MKGKLLFSNEVPISNKAAKSEILSKIRWKFSFCLADDLEKRDARSLLYLFKELH